MLMIDNKQKWTGANTISITKYVAKRKKQIKTEQKQKWKVCIYKWWYCYKYNISSILER